MLFQEEVVHSSFHFRKQFKKRISSTSLIFFYVFVFEVATAVQLQKIIPLVEKMNVFIDFHFLIFFLESQQVQTIPNLKTKLKLFQTIVHSVHYFQQLHPHTSPIFHAQQSHILSSKQIKQVET